MAHSGESTLRELTQTLEEVRARGERERKRERVTLKLGDCTQSFADTAVLSEATLAQQRNSGAQTPNTGRGLRLGARKWQAGWGSLGLVVCGFVGGGGVSAFPSACLFLSALCFPVRANARRISDR